MKNYVFLITILVLAACSSSDQKKSPSDPDLHSRIIGAWTNGENANATLAIENDSIFYLEESAFYKYSIEGDSIKINYPGHSYSGKLSFNGDTLLISSGDGVSRFWPYKD